MNIIDLFDPSTIGGAILWGIVAGVITSSLLSVIGQIFTKIVIPWFQNLVYKGVDLSGKWITQKTYPDGISYHYSLILDQNAHDLKGSMTISKIYSQLDPSDGHQDDYLQLFIATGSTWEGFVTINLTSKDRRCLSIATSLLKIQNRGESLIGHLSYRSTHNDQVESEQIVLTRSQ